MHSIAVKISEQCEYSVELKKKHIRILLYKNV